jgi:hypothetical protein
MPDYRSAPRKDTKQTGTVVVSGRPEIDCTIRDLSASGARLSFRHPTFLPRTFRLKFGEHDQRVTVVWQGGLFAGVRFQSSIPGMPAKKKRSLFWLSR